MAKLTRSCLTSWYCRSTIIPRQLYKFSQAGWRQTSVPNLAQCRHYMKDSDQESVAVRVFEPGKTLPHQQWAIRSNNQNVYLSWCRNGYLCLSVSAVIMMSQKCITPLPYDADLHTGIIGVAHLLLVLSQVNVLVGSTEFLYNLISSRLLTQMSWISIALYSLFVVGHAYIFLDVFSGMESVDDETDI